MTGSFKCELCKNFLGTYGNIRERKCKAFPEGIPEAKVCYITRDPCINCNNGIGYEPEDPAYAKQWEAEKIKYADEYAKVEERLHELHKRYENS